MLESDCIANKYMDVLMQRFPTTGVPCRTHNGMLCSAYVSSSSPRQRRLPQSPVEALFRQHVRWGWNCMLAPLAADVLSCTSASPPTRPTLDPQVVRRGHSTTTQPSTMDLHEVQNATNRFLSDANAHFQRIPGSAIAVRYIKSSYQNDPVRSAIELFLFLFAVRYLLAPKYSTQKKVKLTDAVRGPGAGGRHNAG
jgi:hypothetical protein